MTRSVLGKSHQSKNKSLGSESLSLATEINLNSYPPATTMVLSDISFKCQRQPHFIKLSKSKCGYYVTLKPYGHESRMFQDTLILCNFNLLNKGNLLTIELYMKSFDIIVRLYVIKFISKKTFSITIQFNSTNIYWLLYDMPVPELHQEDLKKNMT